MHCCAVVPNGRGEGAAVYVNQRMRSCAAPIYSPLSPCLAVRVRAAAVLLAVRANEDAKRAAIGSRFAPQPAVQCRFEIRSVPFYRFFCRSNSSEENHRAKISFQA